MYALALFTASAGLECLSPLSLSGIRTVPDVKYRDIGFRDILLAQLVSMTLTYSHREIE